MRFSTFLTESPKDLAHAMGLEDYRFGRYGTKGHVTHHAIAGRLTKVAKYRHEESPEGSLKHLPHIDEAPIDHGVEGARQAIHQLHSIIHNSGDTHVTVKADGSPSFVSTEHEGKHAVATKSAFNKDPKINTSNADIEKNHGHAPGLVSKLKETLHHMKKVHVPGKTVQGDLMFGAGDKHIEMIKGVPHHTFTSNTIKYAVPTDSEEGKKIGRAKIGVAMHTTYDAKGKRHVAEEGDVGNHPDVYKFPMHPTAVHHSEEAHKALSDAGKAFASTPKEAFDAVSHPKVNPHIKTYVNAKITKGEHDSLSADELHQHIHDRYQKDIDALKTEKGKARRIADRDEVLKHVSANKHHINKIFHLTHKINTVKHHIIDAYDRTSPFKHFVGKEETKPEGYVITHHGGSHKLVNRGEFSRLNFLKSKNRIK